MFLGLGVAKFSVWCAVEEPGPGEWHFPTRVSSLWPCVWTSRVFLQEQIQNVFKRVSSYRAALWWCQTDALFVSITSFYFALQFLFHYSKAHNSVGSVEREVWVSPVTVFWRLIKLEGSLTTNNHHFWPLLYMNMLFSPCLQSHSVHPLMRLSPKLSLRRKKQVWRQFSLGCCYCLWDAWLKVLGWRSTSHCDHENTGRYFHAEVMIILNSVFLSNVCLSLREAEERLRHSWKKHSRCVKTKPQLKNWSKISILDQ